jgi:hypothetical protein
MRVARCALRKWIRVIPVDACCCPVGVIVEVTPEFGALAGSPCREVGTAQAAEEQAVPSAGRWLRGAAGLGITAARTVPAAGERAAGQKDPQRASRS